MTTVAGKSARDRRAFIGGSDARIIMGDDEAALVRLWREKRGEVEPEDLSANLIVQLGNVTEHLNRHWYEKNTGHVVTEVQWQVFHTVHRWMAATLDGRVAETGAVGPEELPKRRRQRKPGRSDGYVELAWRPQAVACQAGFSGRQASNSLTSPASYSPA